MTLFQPPKFYPFGSSRSLRTLRAGDYNNFNLTPFSASYQLDRPLPSPIQRQKLP